MTKKNTGRPSWDAPPLKKPRADSKLKNLPEEDQETLWLLLHPMDGETTPYTFDKLAVHILDDHGFEPSLSSLSEWRRWYSLKLRMENAAARAQQAREKKLLEDPDAAEEALDREARFVFKTEALENRDPLSWVRVKKAEQTDKALSHDGRRIVLLEKKAAERDAAKEVTGNEALTPDEKQARLKQIFGMG